MKNSTPVTAFSPLVRRLRTSASLAGLTLLLLGMVACGGNSTPGIIATPIAGNANSSLNPDIALVPFKYDGLDHSWSDKPTGTFTPLALNSGDNDLSAQSWNSATNGWGPVEKNMSNGERNANDGKTLSLNGQTYSTGLGVHASSQIVYALNGQCSSLQSDVGMDDEVRSLGRVTFEVWTDRSKVYDSGPMTGGQQRKSININLSGKTELKLVVTDGGDGLNYDHADWAGATLIGCNANATWSFIAGEGQSFNLPMRSTVRYGVGSNWTQMVLNAGSYTCSNSVFTDPLYGQFKQCELGQVSQNSAPPVADFSASTVNPSNIDIQDTNYPVPSDALIVSPSGNDSNSGTLQNPMQTLTAAMTRAYNRPGTTIVLRAGVYREAPGAFSTRLIIQPYPHEKVWIKGSVVLENWQQDSGVWRQDNFTPNLCRSCIPDGVVAPEAPMAGQPDMVFIDGTPLKQVGSRGQVGAGTFYLDTGAKQLWIGTSPQGHTVEAAVLSSAMMPVTQNADGTVIRGLGFAQFASYASSSIEPAMVVGNANSLTFENNTFAQGASRGLVLTHSANSVIRGNAFINNGLQGFGSHQGDHLLFENNKVIGNNTARFIFTGGQGNAGGVKITNSSDVTVRSNLFKQNIGTGMWFDLSCDDLKITSNTFSQNAGHGLDLELSAHAIIASNLSVNNATNGIQLNNTTQVDIYNNVLAQNNGDLRVVDDSRVNYDGGELSRGITWITGEVRSFNNVFSDNNTNNPLLMVRDYNSTPLKPAEWMLTSSNNNLYYRAGAGNLIEWWHDINGSDHTVNFQTYLQNTGRDSNGTMTNNQMLNDPNNGDFRLRGDAQGLVQPVALPYAVAQAVGVSMNPSMVGILNWSAVPNP